MRWLPRTVVRNQLITSACGLFPKAWHMSLPYLLAVGVIVALYKVLRVDSNLAHPLKHPAQPVWDAENSLPQHNHSIPFPEGWSGRYLHWSNGQEGAGFNNLWEEAMMLHLVAYMAGRAYVFRDIVLADKSRWPLSLFLGGPIVGAPWTDGVRVPRSVSKPYFGTVCPSSRLHAVSLQEFSEERGFGGMGELADGIVLVESLSKYLRDLPDPCVEIRGGNVFNLNFWFDTRRQVSVFPVLLASPVLQQHRWSPHVMAVFERLTPLLAPLPETAVLHIRRGDYIGHCGLLGQIGVPYAAWNGLPGIIDKYVPDTSTEEAKNTIYPHCLPTPQQVLQRLRESVDHLRNKESRALRHVYIMTNGEPAYISELRALLLRDGWSTVWTSLDVNLEGLERIIAPLVDMEIGRQAGLFIGNGFSTVTSSVVMLRILANASYDSIRMW